MSTLKNFMSRVVAWPGAGAPGCVNIHWKLVDKNDPKKTFWGGRPTPNVDNFAELIEWALVRPAIIKDMFFCLSTQAEAGKNKSGRLTVMRKADNAIGVKSIWLDVDVKTPPKGYATLDDALAAILKFVTDAGLPNPTALVGSGGGVHVYWISDRVLTPDEWRPYAEGLKTLAIKHNLLCDAGVTSDIARILRVPGTFNYKTEPPKQTKLLGMQPTDYDFSTALAMLPPLAPADNRPVTEPEEIYFDPKLFPKREAPDIESLADGLRKEPDPLNPFEILKGCAFLRDALATGGKDYDQPQWNLTTLACTFLEKGQALAHSMGKAHPHYTPASTDELWDRKNRERQNRGLGWPSCKAIQAAGCKACAKCAHFAKGKSPLNLASLPLPAVIQAGVNKSIKGRLGDLPPGYALNKEGIICALHETAVRGGPPITELVPLFKCIISDPWVQKGPDAINFVVSIDKGSFKKVSVPMIALASTPALASCMLEQTIKYVPRHLEIIKDFFMSFIAKLHEAEKAMTTLPFGWWQPDGENGKRRGFIYGGSIIKDDGTEQPSGYGDKVIRTHYEPCGTFDAWLAACNMITDQKRPELDVLIAASFAAPLMPFTGEYAVTLSAWGVSGAGKSAAVKVGLAVWGHPKFTKEVTTSTARSIIKRMGEIKHLPLYWDEITDEKIQERVFTALFSGSEGVGPGRLNQNADYKPRTDWQTLITLCSNISFVDYVTKVQPTTDAGTNRVFEYTIKKAPKGAPGQLTTRAASRITQELEYNYGEAGIRYAKVLGSNPEKIDKYVTAVMDAFADRMKQSKEERFWSAVCGALIAGANLANHIGCNLDVAAMEEFLVKAYAKNRKTRMEAGTDGGTFQHTEDMLTNFLKSVVPETIWTDTFAVGQGKPLPVTVLNNLRQDVNPKPCQVQWVVQDRLLRISRKKLKSWMAENRIPPRGVMNGLKEHFYAAEVYARLGAGTSFRGGQEPLLHIPVYSDMPLWDQLWTHTPADEVPAGNVNPKPVGTASADTPSVPTPTAPSEQTLGSPPQ